MYASGWWAISVTVTFDPSYNKWIAPTTAVTAPGVRPATQWYAVTTQFGWMIEPPQKWRFWLRNDTWYGNWPGSAVYPFIIRFSASTDEGIIPHNAKHGSSTAHKTTALFKVILKWIVETSYLFLFIVTFLVLTKMYVQLVINNLSCRTFIDVIPYKLKKAIEKYCTSTQI